MHDRSGSSCVACVRMLVAGVREAGKGVGNVWCKASAMPCKAGWVCLKQWMRRVAGAGKPIAKELLGVAPVIIRAEQDGVETFLHYYYK